MGAREKSKKVKENNVRQTRARIKEKKEKQKTEHIMTEKKKWNGLVMFPKLS